MKQIDEEGIITEEVLENLLSQIKFNSGSANDIWYSSPDTHFYAVKVFPRQLKFEFMPPNPLEEKLYVHETVQTTQEEMNKWLQGYLLEEDYIIEGPPVTYPSLPDDLSGTTITTTNTNGVKWISGDIDFKWENLTIPKEDLNE